MVKARLHASFNIDGRHQPGCALRHEEGNRFSVEIERTVAGTYRVDLMVAGRHVEGLQTRAPLPAASPDTGPPSLLAHHLRLASAVHCVASSPLGTAASRGRA